MPRFSVPRLSVGSSNERQKRLPFPRGAGPAITLIDGKFTVLPLTWISYFVHEYSRFSRVNVSFFMFFTSLEVHDSQLLFHADLYLTAYMRPAGKWKRFRGMSKVNSSDFSRLAFATRFSGGPGRTEGENVSNISRFKAYYNVSEGKN